MVLYYFILFFIIIYYKLNIIFNDEKISYYTQKQYYKKSKKKKIRGNIYDKNQHLINYTKKKYRITKNNKKIIIEKREYLFPSCIGICGLVNEELRGLSGLESFYNNELNITVNKSYFSRITAQEKFKEKYKKIQKKNLFTTLDTVQSDKVYKILNEYVNKFESEYGICIIMDGNTGAVETLTQYPQYNDSNKSNTDIKFLYPLSITQSHEVGSIIKAFLMLTALNENIVTPESLINCYGVKEKIIQGKPLTTWKAHGIIPFKTVIKESNNFGVVQIGLLLNEKLFTYYKNFGFGQKSNIPIDGEHKGILNPISKWSKRSPISLSFGYEMSCTLLQLVSAWSLFTNEGKKIFPKIIMTETSEYSEQICHKIAIDDALNILYFDQSKLKQYGLENKIDANLYGKTGTANTLINNQYNTDINIYTFVGHIEKDNIKKIIGISLYGSNNSQLLSSQVSLPIFLKISELITKNLQYKIQLLE